MNTTKSTTIMVTIDHETNNRIVSDLAEINKETSKHQDGFKTKAQYLSEIIEDYFLSKPDGQRDNKE